MAKQFLYLRGLPGTGKITVAKILKKKLGYRLFWFHDLKNAVQDIVGEHRIPRLMDEITAPVIRYLIEKQRDIIYVRPSPDAETVNKIRALAQSAGYHFCLITLTATPATLAVRVIQRKDPYRISTEVELDNYIKEKPAFTQLADDHWIDTDTKTPEETAEKIIQIVSE